MAKTVNQAMGIVGKKGVLWWEIHRLLDAEAAAVPLPRERRPPAEVAGATARP